MDTQNNKFILPAIILGGAGIVMSLFAGLFMYKIRALSNVVTVTGSAQKEVRADNGAIMLTVSRTVAKSARALGYANIAKDTNRVTTFLGAKGIAQESIQVDSPTEFDVYIPDTILAQGVEPKITISQQITATSTSVDLIDSIATGVNTLIGEGITTTQSVKYTYEKLPEERVSLLAEAIKDARARATAIAQDTGTSVGPLQSASSGVAQVLAKGSVDISDYGTYDTSTIDKVVMVTTKATFRLK